VISVGRNTKRDYRQLQQIIAGLAEGVILVDVNRRILWANEAALAMHGVARLEDLGTTIDEYRQRFRLRYRNNHPLGRGDHPIERVIAGEVSCDVTVEVSHVDDLGQCWVHAIRCFVVADDQDKPDYLILIIEDETARFEAEERFEAPSMPTRHRPSSAASPICAMSGSIRASSK
jgi:PAS domain-containing protein